MSKHTPGPWEVQWSKQDGYWITHDPRIQGDHKTGLQIICTLGMWKAPSARADAHLIAASPSMLQLLESIKEAWGDHADDVTKSVDPFELRDWLFDTLMPEVRQEIAKAKGTASDPL